MIQQTCNNSLMNRKVELEARQAAFLKCVGNNELKRLIILYIKPRDEDVQMQEGALSAGKRIFDLDRAMKALDIPTALANGQLVPLSPDSQANVQTTMFFDFIARHRELAGLTKGLKWLETFANSVVNSDEVIEVMRRLVQLGVSPCHCDCKPEDVDDADRYPELAWLHAHHAEYNRAVWEILASKPGLIKDLRQAIQKDIEGPEQRFGRHSYGQEIARSYARALLQGFVRLPRPTAKWVGSDTV